MTIADKAEAAADFLWRAHRERQRYENLPDAFAPNNAEEAYAAQEAFHRRAETVYGPIAGLKIATTTKVMQALMGIDHPCGGAIFRDRIHASPATLRRADYGNLRLECEIACKLGQDIDGDGPTDAGQAAGAVSHVAPAFELIDDRRAVYRQTRAYSLIADNAWNGGIVHGAWHAFDSRKGLGTIEGRLMIDGVEKDRGKPDGPFEALAWLANLARGRGRPLRAGMVVITGSLIATFDPPPAAEIVFTLDTLGEVNLRVL